MPKVVILTNADDQVGEVPVYVSERASRQYGKPIHGWDGIKFEQLWAEAERREMVAEMVAETHDA
jgi:hypothetical protein